MQCDKGNMGAAGMRLAQHASMASAQACPGQRIAARRATAAALAVPSAAAAELHVQAMGAFISTYYHEIEV